MIDTLVDTNVLLDVVGLDPVWRNWSRSKLIEAADIGRLVINQVVYAELAAGYDDREQLESMLTTQPFERESIPWDAAFMAGTAHLIYRRRGGAKTSPLPDFFIGAHAAIRRYRLLTRDRGHYAAYFPTLEIISPERAA